MSQLSTDDQPPEAPGLDRSPVPCRRVLARVAAVANVGSAAIHFVVIPVHVQESAVLGAGFLVAAWAQLGAAVWLLRSSRRSPHIASLAVNVLIAGVWLVSRTVGLPVGGGAAEAIAFTDATATGLELSAIALAVAALARPGRRHRLSGIAATRSMTSATLVVVALASAATVAGIAGGHDHGRDSGTDAHAKGGADGRGHARRLNGATAPSSDAAKPPPDYWRSRLRAYRVQRGIAAPPAGDEEEAFRQLLDHLGIVPPAQGLPDPRGSTAHDDDGHTH